MYTKRAAETGRRRGREGASPPFYPGRGRRRFTPFFSPPLYPVVDVPPQTVFAVPSAPGGHRPSSPFPLHRRWPGCRSACLSLWGWVAALRPFSPCADGLSFPCVHGVCRHCPPPFPCTDRRKGRLPLFSSRRWDRGAAPPLLAAAGRRDRSASPRSGGAERPFRLSLQRWDRGAAPLLLTSEGRALSLPPHAGQGLHPHSATPVGPGRALPTPSLCGATPPPQGKGRCLYRVLPQKGGAQRRLAGKKKRWTVGDGQGCPVLSRSPFPLRPSGKRSLLREGAAPAILQSSGAAALCPKPLSSPLQAPSAGHPPPAFYPPFAPSIPQVPCPHMDSAGREKKSPGPHRGGAELF